LSRSADHDDLSQNQWDIKHGFALLNIRVREETLVDIGDEPGAVSGGKIRHCVAMLSPCLVGEKLEIWLLYHFRFYLTISVQSWTN